MNKKINQKQKSDITKAEIGSIELKGKEVLEAMEEVQKDEQTDWKELNERNFTLEEILSLETNNAVTLMVSFLPNNNCKSAL